jgi:hypothetical protein
MPILYDGNAYKKFVGRPEGKKLFGWMMLKNLKETEMI